MTKPTRAKGDGRPDVDPLLALVPTRPLMVNLEFRAQLVSQAGMGLHGDEMRKAVATECLRHLKFAIREAFAKQHELIAGPDQGPILIEYGPPLRLPQGGKSE